MAPFIVLVSSFALFRCIGWFGAGYFDNWQHALQAAVALMLLLTASAHWGKRRADLIRMVPPAFPNPALIITVTGILEIAGAIGILLPALSLASSLCLVLLFLAMFPANLYAAKHRLTIAGTPVPGLLLRSVLQLVFLAAVVLASPLV
ncbi:DoxX family protein [Paenibacillus ferrarius]|uniref:DoxX family protein n=1 Tax=Paenibacillus ferrarius TaxID=1469647 RepID=UPI003D2DEE74